MKRFLALTLAAIGFAIVSAPTAVAQSYEPITLLSGGTRNISAGATSNYTSTVFCPRADFVGILTGTKLTGAGTEGIIFKFSKSMDGATYETTPSVLITNTSNGATAVNKFTVIDVTGVHTLKLASIVNGSSGEAVTNLTVKVGVKNSGN